MPGIKPLLFIITGLFLILLFKHIRLKKQICNLSEQMDELNLHKSEKMLDISLIDKDLERLAGILNQYNDKQRQMVAKALRHEEYLKETIANISHDLRTPLTVILGHLQLLKKDGLLDEQVRRLETVLNKAQKMKELVETFYDLAVLDAEQINPQQEYFNLSNLLINLITENAPAFEVKNIHPGIDLPDYTVYLNSDRNMVERILQNLLTNAISYSSGTIQIKLSQNSMDGICFTIQNSVKNSIVLNPDRLFERFYTGDKSRHDGSTGLGLAVVKTLVQELGGSVTAYLQSDILIIKLKL